MSWNKCSTYTNAIPPSEPILFDYTGSIQSYTIPFTGSYKLEVWGGQGTDSTYLGGKGGYSCGEISLERNSIIYICVGGASISNTAGYNGGARGGGEGTASGGATHIAISGGTNSILSSYSNPTDASQYICLVAGGGGGGTGKGVGGFGGGLTGGTGGAGSVGSASGGTQTSGYAFGQGADMSSSSVGGGGGGGGWYGGNAITYSGGGGGGSGYVNLNKIKNISIIPGNGIMPTHDGTSTMTGNSGNGFAKLTFIDSIIASKSFIYTGGIESFTAPYTGTYRFDVYGGAGASLSYAGGKGGYSTGTVTLTAGDSVYIAVGGAGNGTTAGYNGGGSGSGEGRSGGGATHIGKTLGLLKDTSKDNLYIVAGGGGGGSGKAAGGAGGGTSGGQGGSGSVGPAAGGTQTSGYAFGQGASNGNGGGGGGGLYGGYATSYGAGGGGGSGYIGGVSNGTTTAGQQSGNGSAVITYIS